METLKKRFLGIYPDKFFLNNAVEEVWQYLFRVGWLLPDEEIISLEKPGEGNMNRVLRVKTNKRSFILKQARPWVEKYPGIDAPVERNAVESRYYSAANRDPVMHGYSPEILGTDPDNFIMAVSDLGQASDFLYLYAPGKTLGLDILKDLMRYLSYLHALPAFDFPSNKAMRDLNHEHIFRFPFAEDNGFDLETITVGLEAAALPFKQDQPLKSIIAHLGNLYLEEGPVLIHGDFYLGSWLHTESGLKVIDPEFSFRGYPEFDLGVMIAHLVMAQQPASIISSVMEYYNFPDGFDQRKLAGFAGTEILRRLIGVAQLPLSLTLTEKVQTMERAADWIRSGNLNIIA